MSAPSLASRYFHACSELGVPAWLAGMHNTKGDMYVHMDSWISWSSKSHYYSDSLTKISEPDFAHPTVVGRLMDCAIKAWSDRADEVGIFITPKGGRWSAAVRVTGPKSSGFTFGIFRGDTPAEALVCALEQAVAARKKDQVEKTDENQKEGGQ